MSKRSAVLAHPRGVTEESSFIETPRGRIYSARVLPVETKTGVVICSSLHAELLSNYRAEVALARSLAARGIAVQRFHPLGQGHSDDAPLSVTSIQRDARTVVESFKTEVGLETVGYVGARFGGLIAAEMAAADGAGPLALWEPALDGESYLRSVFRAHATFLMGDEGQELDPDPKGTMAREGKAEVLGYVLERSLCDEIAALSLEEALLPHTGPILLVQLSHRAGLSKAYSRFAEGLPGIQTIAFREEPVWWLLKPPVTKLNVLLEATASWLESSLKATGATG